MENIDFAFSFFLESILILTLLIELTWTSNVKYFFRFLMIMTRNGSLIPSVFFGSAGHVINVVDTFDEMISSTSDWMSLSVIRFMCPFRTFNVLDTFH